MFEVVYLIYPKGRWFFRWDSIKMNCWKQVVFSKQSQKDEADDKAVKSSEVSFCALILFHPQNSFFWLSFSGVFFDNRVENIKFIDFCGKYRVPFLQVESNKSSVVPESILKGIDFSLFSFSIYVVPGKNDMKHRFTNLPAPSPIFPRKPLEWSIWANKLKILLKKRL